MVVINRGSISFFLRFAVFGGNILAGVRRDTLCIVNEQDMGGKMDSVSKWRYIWGRNNFPCRSRYFAATGPNPGYALVLFPSFVTRRSFDALLKTLSVGWISSDKNQTGQEKYQQWVISRSKCSKQLTFSNSLAGRGGWRWVRKRDNTCWFKCWGELKEVGEERRQLLHCAVSRLGSVHWKHSHRHGTSHRYVVALLVGGTSKIKALFS